MQSDPIEDMTQFMLAFTGESSPVDDVPFSHEALWLEWTQDRMEATP